MSGDNWRDSALCAQTNPDMFVPDKGQSSLPAKRIYAECPVRAQCLQHAMDNNIREGIYGGLSVIERRALRRAAA